MKLVSWNVNGLRAVIKKDFARSLDVMAPDVLCLQETKAQPEQVTEALAGIEGYHIFCHSAVKKGYSSSAMLCRNAPLTVTNGIGSEEHDQEGRVMCAEYRDFYLVAVYTPNSGSGLKRLGYRQQWDEAFLNYLTALQAGKPVVVCGDLNVAHRDIDLARPKANYNKSAGYTQQEIDGIDRLLAAGYVDSFRHMNPLVEQYSWWSYRAGARERNVGWRIDYFLTSEQLIERYVKAEIHDDILGSDHCPVSLELSLPDH